MARVLVACEFSGRVRDAFTNIGFDAWSCDIIPSELPGNHIQDDVLRHLSDGWDLMVAHPPCTYLAVSGARWLHDARYPTRVKDQQEAIQFFKALANAPIDKIAIENPVGIMSSIMKQNFPNFLKQIIQPYYFGEEATKTTCLWLKNLPPLFHLDKPNLFGDRVTHVSDGGVVVTKTQRKWSKWFYDTSLLPYEIRGHERSKTFQGIADAMAEQWGKLLLAEG
jgi:hypothetical protein